MPERLWDSSFWDDEFIQGLPPLGKLLFFYLGNNPICNQAGVYSITLKTISDDTGIEREQLKELLPMLKERAEWYPETNTVWVKNFIKRQCKNPSFLTGAARCLREIRSRHPELVERIVQYYEQSYGINLNSSTPSTTILTPSDTMSDSVTPSHHRVNTVSHQDSTVQDSILTVQDSKKRRQPPSDVQQQVKKVFEWLKDARGYNSPVAGKEAKAITWMLNQNYSFEQITSCFQELKKDKFWADKPLDMEHVKKNIGEMTNGKTRGHTQKTPSTEELIADIGKPLFSISAEEYRADIGKPLS